MTDQSLTGPMVVAPPRSHARLHSAAYSSAGNVLVRLGLFLTFALVVYQWAYLPAREGRTFLDWGHLVENTGRAANDGRLFMAYTPEPGAEPIRLNEYAGGHTDPGLAMLVSLASAVGRALFGGQF